MELLFPALPVVTESLVGWISSVEGLNETEVRVPGEERDNLLGDSLVAMALLTSLVAAIATAS